MKLNKLVLAMSATVLMTSQAMATDMVRYQTSGNVDFAAFGYGGMRGLGTGSVGVSGVTGTVTQALLYWHGPTNSTDANVNAGVTFAGQAVTGTHLGESNGNCWGFDNSRSYRADVTSLVSGNGDYSLADFKKGDADINGVTLMILFDDGNPDNNVDLVIFDGNDSNKPFAGELDGWNANLSGINYTSGTAGMLMVVADGQTFTDHGVDINGTAIFPPNSPNFQGDSVPNGPSASSTNGGLWDHENVDVTSLLSPGPNTLNLTTTSTSSDCTGLVGLAFNFPVGAVLPPPPPPPPGPPLQPAKPVPVMGVWGLLLLGGGLLSAAFGFRRKLK